MNENEYGDLGTQLTRTLNDHAGQMAGSSFGLTEVKGRARSIRRRRTATGVVGATAAVALLVPTVALASHRHGTTNEPLPATQTPSQTTTATPDTGHQPKPGVLDVSDLPTGAAPGVAYVTNGTTLHLAGGGTTDTGTSSPVVGLVDLQGSSVYTTNDQGRFRTEVVGYDGTKLGTWPSTGSLTVNDAHTLAAWVSPAGQVMVWKVGGLTPLVYGAPVPAGDGLRMGPLLGDECGPQGNCEVYVNVPDQQGLDGWQPWLVDVNGTQKYLDGTYSILADATEGSLSIGYRSISDSGSCSILLGAGEFQGFETCKHTLVSFSPDGRLILGDPAYHDGIGNGVIAMYDIKGNVLFERHSTEKAQAFYPEAQWEDDTHVLAPVFQEGKWALVRIASDGSMEYAVAPAAGDEMENPFVVAQS